MYVTALYDRTEKLACYRRCAMLEVYMLVHQDEPLVEVYRKERGWKQELFGEGQMISLEQLDLEFSLKAIYEGVL
ncbi:hypothetical protein KSF_029740 [Reticulibacter mediterranei]|uniref:Putative restriction endonuclease domain-containing protein n=1 Tax=Reticulibacter mediterranei TaxID=2778369 RepID=A0A8J3IMH4_9CHLR|nr:Uma2 family endonuclease [Reticulibacter mediterranei]GHO92926.1 hypothetical protein KSF_029740 [Reticulibacter mediterranei]